MDRSLTSQIYVILLSRRNLITVPVLIIIIIICSKWFTSNGTSSSGNNSTFTKKLTSLTTQETTISTTILPIITRENDSVFDYLIDANENFKTMNKYRYETKTTEFLEASKKSLTIQATNATILPIITLDDDSVFDYDPVFDYLIDGNENFKTMSYYRYKTKTNEFVKTTSILATTTISPIEQGLNYNNVLNYLIIFGRGNRTAMIQPYENVDWKFLFEAIEHHLSKDKHLEEFTIENQYLERISENFTGAIRIDRVRIRNSPKLKYMHWNSFGNQAKFIKQFHAAANLTTINDSDYDLFKLINSMENSEEIIMNSFDSKLRQIELKELKKLSFNGLHSSTKIEEILDNAFYNCDKIESIDLKNNDIIYIGEKAFNLKYKNDKRLVIYLNDNKLYSHSFALNSLANFKRPVTLDLSGNFIKNLDVKVFKPFFDSNPANIILIYPYFCNYKWFYYILDSYEFRIEKVNITLFINVLTLTPERKKLIKFAQYQRDALVKHLV